MALQGRFYQAIVTVNPNPPKKLTCRTLLLLLLLPLSCRSCRFARTTTHPEAHASRSSFVSWYSHQLPSVERKHEFKIGFVTGTRRMWRLPWSSVKAVKPPEASHTSATWQNRDESQDRLADEIRPSAQRAVRWNPLAPRFRPIDSAAA